MISYKRISRYYPAPDGCRLAVDIYLPEHTGSIPAVLYTGRGTRREHFEENKDFLILLMEHGYAVVLPDVRGFGASFGATEGFHGRTEARDNQAIMEAIAKEDWCSGNFGMFGGSNCGFIQDLTAAECPAPLKAVIPCDCHPDLYYQDYPNGASRHIEFIGGLPRDIDDPGDPVDEDTDGSLLAAAREDHKKNRPFLGQYFPNMRRDTVNPDLGYAPLKENTIWERMEPVTRSDIHYYKNGAWYDPGAAGAIFAFKGLGGRLLIGPWRHVEIYQCCLPDPTPEEIQPWRQPIGLPNASFPWKKEYIRFFDETLKGIDNGCFEEPPIRYYVRQEEAGREWKYAADIPLDGQKACILRLSGKKSGTIDSCYDGTLSGTDAPDKRDAGTVIPYTLNRDITLFGLLGTLNRRIEGDFQDESLKCLTFTSEPFEEAAQFTGIPELDIEVTSDYPDGIFLAVLEEVYPDGTTCYLTDGAIRASHAHIGSHPSYDSLGLPYHPGLSDDLVSLDPQTPLMLKFILDGFSQVIKKGSRLRLSVFCGEKLYQQPPCIGPEDTPHIGLHLKNSVLKLPFVAPDAAEFCGEVNVREISGQGLVCVFNQGIYICLNDKWHKYPCTEIEKTGENKVIYHTADFNVVKETTGQQVTVSASGLVSFVLTETLPARS